MNKASDVMRLKRLRSLAALPDDQIDTADLPVVADWSRGIRGGTPGEVRQKPAALGERRASEPKVIEHLTDGEVTHLEPKTGHGRRYALSWEVTKLRS